jgi:hypothetical protein
VAKEDATDGDEDNEVDLSESETEEVVQPTEDIEDEQQGPPPEDDEEDVDNEDEAMMVQQEELVKAAARHVEMAQEPRAMYQEKRQQAVLTAGLPPSQRVLCYMLPTMLRTCPFRTLQANNQGLPTATLLP